MFEPMYHYLAISQLTARSVRSPTRPIFAFLHRGCMILSCFGVEMKSDGLGGEVLEFARLARTTEETA